MARLEAAQSYSPEEPSTRQATTKGKSHKVRPGIIATFGAAAVATLSSIACGDGRDNGPKTPTQSPPDVGTMTTEMTAVPEPTVTPVELPLACDITFEKFNTLRQIDGKNWTEVANEASGGRYRFTEVSEIIQFPGGNRAKYLDTYPDTHGGSGRFVIKVDLQTGEKTELRDPETIGKDMFDSLFPDDPNNSAYYPFQRIKPEDSQKVLAWVMATDGSATSEFNGQSVQLADRQVLITFDIWRLSVDPYSGQAAAQVLRVTSNTKESPPPLSLLSNFPISIKNGESAGTVAFCDLK